MTLEHTWAAAHLLVVEISDPIHIRKLKANVKTGKVVGWGRGTMRRLEGRTISLEIVPENQREETVISRDDDTFFLYMNTFCDFVIFNGLNSYNI